MSVTSNSYDTQPMAQDDTARRGQSSQDPIVEVITPEVYTNSGAGGSRDAFSGIWSRTLRVKITGRDGFEKLDVRIPVSSLSIAVNINRSYKVISGSIITLLHISCESK